MTTYTHQAQQEELRKAKEAGLSRKQQMKLGLERYKQLKELREKREQERKRFNKVHPYK